LSKPLFEELKRRNVFKVGFSYILLGWVVLQIADVLVPALSLPDWTISLIFLLGLLGFPFALFFAWAFELTPEGLKRESEVSTPESMTSKTGRKLDFVIIGLLVLALSYSLWEPQSEKVISPSTVESINAHQTSKPEPQPPTLTIPEKASIAVLPFVNMSGDPNQEYFSDGISEELLNLLAKIPGLQVAARTSSFQFKGRHLDIKEIAIKLGVRTILEGSIRKSGNTVRITAQLIKADDGFHLWSETYDRELDDIFKVQDEISSAIVSSLKSSLGIEVDPVRIKTETINISPKAYDFYLRGLKGLNTSSFPSLKQAQQRYQQTLDIEPSFIPAKLGLAEALQKQFSSGSTGDTSILERAENILYRVLESSPKSAEALYILSVVELNNRKFDSAVQHFKAAYTIEPNNHRVITTYTGFLFNRRLTNYIPNEQLRLIYRNALVHDPLNAPLQYSWGLINVLLFMDYETAEKSYLRAMELAPENGNPPYFESRLADSNLGDLVKSIKYLKVAHKVDTTDPDSSISLSTNYLSLADLERAIYYSNRALKISANSGQAISAKVGILLYQKKYTEALKLIVSSLANDEIFHRRSSKSLLLQAGIYLHLRNGRADEALTMLLKYVPNLTELIDSAQIQRSFALGTPVSTYAILLREKNDNVLADKLIQRLSLITEDSLQGSLPRLNGWHYFLLAHATAPGNTTESDAKTIAYLTKMYESGFIFNWRMNLLWSPDFMHLKDNPKFIALIDRIEADMKRQRAFLDAK